MVLSPAMVTNAAIDGGALTSLYTPDFATHFIIVYYFTNSIK